MGGSQQGRALDQVALSRRSFIRAVGAAGLGFALYTRLPGGAIQALAGVPGTSLDPASIPKFMTPMLVPPVMPRAGTVKMAGGKPGDYYEISVRQFDQQILPAGMPKTTVWGYGPLASDSKRGLLLRNAPSLTIEAKWKRPVRVRWVNELVDADGNYLPHLLPVDPTLHWANPRGGVGGRDTRPQFEGTPGRYRGPVPLVTHLHGAAGVGDESDGYAEAWYLPAAKNIPTGYATEGTWYDFFATKARARNGVAWSPGSATFQYPNPDRARTQWYHDHTLGMTRLNVYAGPAGFYLIRGGPGDTVLDSRTGAPAVLPGPAPAAGDKFPPSKRYREMPIAIQDRAFNVDGSLFYPDTREYFDGIVGGFIPEGDFSPFWNPEFFGNTIMVNGCTWPYLPVQRRRYRFRFLNACQSRFLILDFAAIPGVEVWQIGNDGGFLDAPVNVTAAGNRLQLALAERADVIVDFTNVAAGNYVLHNVAPDEPFGGGEPEDDFDVADPATTGQIMQFRVSPARSADSSTPARFLTLPPRSPLPAPDRRRQLALIERAAFGYDADDNQVEGPTEARLGVLETGSTSAKGWMDPVTENPATGSTEVWEIYNTTADAHPVHVHEVTFEVVDRQRLRVGGEGDVAQPVELDGPAFPPEPTERGVKDTVTAYPGQVTRIKARFDVPGQYVWHCHIIEHEDNEMMRPFRIGPMQPGQPG